MSEGDRCERFEQQNGRADEGGAFLTARILTIIPSGSGGALMVAEDIVTWLREAGHDVLVLTVGQTSVLTGESGCLISYTGTFSLRHVLRLLKRYRIQLVHCHLHTYWLAALAGFLAGIPTVRTVHGSLSRPGMLAPKEFAKCWISYHLLSQHVVAVNDGVGREIAHYFRMRLGDHLWVIPNGCRIRSAPVGKRTGNGVQFAFVGRLEAAKGFDVLLKAFGDVRDNCVGVRLVVIGDGPLRHQIPENLVASGDICVSSGWLDRHQVHQWLGCADALVLPSKTEGTPMVVLEAMTLGVPAVVSVDANHSSLVEHGFNGLVFETTSTDDLAAKLTWCIQSPDSMAEMGMRAMQTALQWNRRCAAEYTKLLGRLTPS